MRLSQVRDENGKRGLVVTARAIAGSEVAMTVESMFSMNSAVAMISGTARS